MAKQTKNYDKKIDKSFTIIKRLTVISFILAFVTFMLTIILSTGGSEKYLNSVIMLIAPFIVWILCPVSYHYPYKGVKPSAAICITLIVVTFLPYIYALMLIIITSLTEVKLGYLIISIARCCGYNFLAYLLLYIGDGFLIYMHILLKRQWKNNSSDFIKNQSMEKQYKPLIEKCGARFFIKYYKQIKLLPLRDVKVSENYGSAEKDERLRAAKKIIDSNLSEFALNKILEMYSDILDDDEIKEAKKLLTELKITSQPDSFYPPLR